MSILRFLSQHRVATAFAILLLLLLATLGATLYAFNYPRFILDQQQTLVFGPTQFSPDSLSALRVLVRDQTAAQPIADANVTVRLAPKQGFGSQTLFSGKTDARGTVPVAFTIPAATAREQTLIVETNSSAGRDRVEKAVTVERTYKLLVTTDKPLYQPNQTIYLRALALGALDRVPAKETALEFLVEDPKGNKLYRKTVQTSAYGVASAEFVLADMVTSGDYKITASIGDTKSEKTVNVKPYVLPKFKLSVETERNYYLPGERVTGRVRADYFFGKPVAKSDVTIKGIVYDVARAESINLTGKTDNDGVYSFAFTLPNYFAASGLNRNRADFGLEVAVTDQANHSEQTSLTLPIASDPIIIDAVPESGKLVADVENIVYVLTSLPDGSPVEADLIIGNRPSGRTGKYGLAEVKITPTRGNVTLAINARDARGRSATRTINLQTETTTTQILLRSDRATYRVGETMHLDALTSGSVGSVYLDLIKEKQTLSTRAADAANGRASFDIDVSAEMIGTMQLHAYHVERDGTITRDTRVVVVEQPSELSVAIKPDRDVYRPGDSARVSFTVTNRDGKGIQSALGVTAVDESVFALAEQDPGFAKLYFLLQKELLEPKFQVKGFTLPDVVTEPPAQKPADLRLAQDQSARAAWAGAPVSDFALRSNTTIEKSQAAATGQQSAFNQLGGWLAIVLSVIPLAVGALVVLGLRAQKILAKSLSIWLGGMLGYCIVSPIFVGVIAFGGVFLIQAGLGFAVTALITLAWLCGFGILAAHAVVKRDARLGVILALIVVHLLVFALLMYVGKNITAFGDWGIFAIVLAYLAGLGALVLLGIGLLVQKQVTAGIAAIFLAMLFIPATILIAILPSAGPLLRAMGSPALYVPPAYLTGCAAAPSARDLQPGNLFDRLQGGGVAPAFAPVPAATAVPAPSQAQPSASGATEPPRLRQYFPETLYVNPQAITDESGRVSLDIALADSITTWRLAATASSQRGELGTASAGIRVIQDFFVDLDLPVALTQNDEISIPVAVYNYLPQAQKVRLQIEKQAWFALQDPEEKSLTIASNDIDVVYFRIRAQNFGQQKIKITALGEKMSDAIQRDIRVYPDGKLTEATQSNWLKDGTTQIVDIPPPAIPGATRVVVKIYPGIVSQVVDGLDGVLRMPFG